MEILGSIVPRLWTPPLVTGPPGPCGCGCALTPETSYGFLAVEFVESKLGRFCYPWQRWLNIHAGELTDEDIPRFRQVISTVGRQSGKTRGVEDLSLFWIFEEKQPSILGTSTLLKYAKKPWMSAFLTACASKELRKHLGADPRRKAMRKQSGEEVWWTVDGSEYAVAASNAEGGRSMSNTRVIADEFAKQYNYDAYGAAYYSMDAFENAQYFALTTPDPKGVPYRDLRGAALEYIRTGEGDPTLGLFEWSMPVGADPRDPLNLAMANPTMNRPGGKRGDRLLNQARAAVAKGGELLRTFSTEVCCMQVDDIDAPINLTSWRHRCLDVGTMDAVRSRVALLFDVALSLRHATLYAAAELADGRIRIEPVQAWEGIGCVDRAVRDLPALVGRVRPKLFGWLPFGPAAAAGAKLSSTRLGVWPPRGVTVQEIRGELTQVCMGFSQLVDAGQIAHSADPLLDADIEAAAKLPRGDGWVFTRRGEGDCDALYAAAGAAWLAQTLDPTLPSFEVLLPTVR
jgi:hypothetical protein